MVRRIYKMFTDKLGLSQYEASYLTVVTGILSGILIGGAAAAVVSAVFGYGGIVIVNGSSFGAIVGCLASYVGLLNIG